MPISDFEREDTGYEEACSHIAIVSINPSECQCMDCLLTWPKRPDFKSDFPEFDRG